MVQKKNNEHITLMRLNICVDEDIRILLLLLYVGVKDDTCEDTTSTTAIAAIQIKAMMFVVVVFVVVVVL